MDDTEGSDMVSSLPKPTRTASNLTPGISRSQGRTPWRMASFSAGIGIVHQGGFPLGFSDEFCQRKAFHTTINLTFDKQLIFHTSLHAYQLPSKICLANPIRLPANQPLIYFRRKTWNRPPCERSPGGSFRFCVSFTWSPSSTESISDSPHSR